MATVKYWSREVTVKITDNDTPREQLAEKILEAIEEHDIRIHAGKCYAIEIGRVEPTAVKKERLARERARRVEKRVSERPRRDSGVQLKAVHVPGLAKAVGEK